MKAVDSLLILIKTQILFNHWIGDSQKSDLRLKPLFFVLSFPFNLQKKCDVAVKVKGLQIQVVTKKFTTEMEARTTCCLLYSFININARQHQILSITVSL